MATTPPLVLRLVASSLAISRRVGNIIRDITAGGQLGIVDKGVNDFQTQADRSAQRCIVESLSKNFPKVSIIGEEDLEPAESVDPEWIETSMDEEVLKQTCPDYLQSVQDEDVVVWVDPLDGTSEYTQGLLDHITVLIGVAVKGEAVGGVIYQPYYNYQAGPEVARGRAVWGIDGLGMFGIEDTSQAKSNTIVPTRSHSSNANNTEDIEACKTSDMVDGSGHKAKFNPIIVTTRSHSSNANTEAIEACNPSDILRVGGSGHKVLLVLEGIATAYVYASLGTKKWDTCAPEAIIKARGGKLTDILGNNLDYQASAKRMNSAGVLATLEDHQKYIDHIPDSVKQTLIP